MRAIILVPLLLLAACGARYDEAETLRSQGRLVAAAAEYRDFALGNPRDPMAAKALLAAADIYAVSLGVCKEAKPLLERLVRQYPDFRVPEDSFRRIFVCPDYFPTGPGLKWTYGDSQTLGRNARTETEVVDHTSKGAVVKTAFYAGRSLVSRKKSVYRFGGLDFIEAQGGAETLTLRYPLEQGKSWGSRGPEGRLTFKVEKTGLAVKVKAGTFQDCVKVSRRAAGIPSWIYEYYAPWTGKILTSVGGPGYENRVTELLSYEEKK